MKDHEFKIIRSCGVLLLLVTSWAWGNQRTTTALTENWHIKQLDRDKPDVAALSRSAASSDQTWLSARMPAKVHEILLQHGKISDPHISKNAADSAWVGDKDWAYRYCRSPQRQTCGFENGLRWKGERQCQKITKSIEDDFSRQPVRGPSGA